MSYIIGLDCGGTHTVGQLWNKEDELLVDEITDGPGNVVMDYDSALSNIVRVINTLLNNNLPKKVDMILLGIAGIESSDKKDTITQCLNKKFKIPVNVISDAKLALLNGLQGQDGALIISGTGSIIYGKQNGHYLRVGGLGYILGDEGSAYNIGCTALKEVLTYIDSGNTSSLEEPLFAFLKVKNKKEAIAKFYSNGRTENANMAMVVANQADNHNLEALGILDTCAETLANQAVTLLNRFDKPTPKKIALSGSVLTKNKRFNKLLRNYISNKVNDVEFIDVTINNAHGALYFD
jgi:N-acetylglucosamine kinase-like BadF-type ATPase